MMTTTEIIQSFSTDFLSRQKFTSAQQAVYEEKLRRFSDDQLSAIYDRLLETCKFRPTIPEIFDIARELGFLASEPESFKAHPWQATNCRLCRGEGRLCITWILAYVIRDGERVEIETLNRIVAYSESCDSAKFKLQFGEYRSIARCSCTAGDAAGIPKSWPRWNTHTRPSTAVR